MAENSLRLSGQQQFVKTQPTYVDLTDRERDVLTCLVSGMSYKLIADACAISFHTVHYHIRHSYEKLHVNSAPEAVVKAVEQILEWRSHTDNKYVPRRVEA